MHDDNRILGSNTAALSAYGFGPAAVVALGLSVWLGYLLTQILSINAGQYVYYLDDAYIHLGVAKNLLRFGVVGINSPEPVSVTSSPLFNALQAFGLFLGLGEWVSLVIGLLSFLGLLAITRLACVNAQLPPVSTALCWLLLGFAAPLGYATLMGMEHLLHLTLSTGLLVVWAGPMDGKAEGTRQNPLLLAGLAGACMLTRFDSFVLLAPMIGCDLFFGDKPGRLRALWLILGVSLPTLSFLGWQSLQGATFMPNSLRIKASAAGGGLLSTAINYLHKLQVNIIAPSQFLRFCAGIVLCLAGLLQVRVGKATGLTRMWLVLGAAASLSNIFYMGMGEISRYDIWIVGLLCLVAVLSIFKTGLPSKALPMMLIVVLPMLALYVLHLAGGVRLYYWIYIIGCQLAAFVMLAAAITRYGLADGSRYLVGPLLLALCLYTAYARSQNQYDFTVRASHDIYCQQIQMAHFVGRYYHGETIVLNDIGTISFFTDCPIVDRFGLATDAMVSHTIAYWASRSNGPKLMTTLDSLATKSHAPIALLYDKPNWLPKYRPKGWILAGYLEAPGALYVGDAKVAVFALGTQNLPRLRIALERFSHEVPAGVKISLL